MIATILGMVLGATVFTEDVTFVDGDDYWTVEIREGANADVLGGMFGNAFHLYDDSTAEFRGGDVRGVLGLHEASAASIYAGNVNTYITASGTSVLDVYGGGMPDGYMELLGDCMATFHGHSLNLDPDGGSEGDGLVTGWLDDGSWISVSLRGDDAASRVELDGASVPEPCIFDMFAVSALLFVAFHAVGRFWRRSGESEGRFLMRGYPPTEEVKKVVALFVADIHLSSNPPSARSAEPDWFAAMGRPLIQLRDLSSKHDAPVVCAGDVFEKWNSNPELINWAIANMPKMWAIPGQHDLPNHNYGEIRRSAYWTLVEAGVVSNLEIDGALFTKILMYGYQPGEPCKFRSNVDLAVRPFPWGVDIEPFKEEDEDVMYVAVAHRFIWSNQGNSYPGVPKEQYVNAAKRKLEGYDVAVFGDNHVPFESGRVFNCGCLIPRKIGERNHRPSVGLLMGDGTMVREYLDTSEDLWLDEPPAKDEHTLDMTDFLASLDSLDADSLDFPDAIERYVRDNELSEEAEAVLNDVMGN